MQVWEFEEKVLSIEGVQIIVRASIYEEVEDYDYARKMNGSKTISEWKNVRLLQCLQKFEFQIIDGNGYRPHGSTLMQNLRSSYNE